MTSKVEDLTNFRPTIMVGIKRHFCLCGKGGCATIVKSKQNRTVAVKKLKITAQDFAHRELRIADELVNHLD
jgi:hypothetical protein